MQLTDRQSFYSSILLIIMQPNGVLTSRLGATVTLSALAGCLISDWISVLSVCTH